MMKEMNVFTVLDEAELMSAEGGSNNGIGAMGGGIVTAGSAIGKAAPTPFEWKLHTAAGCSQSTSCQLADPEECPLH